jgi:alcohol dehydrogenase
MKAAVFDTFGSPLTIQSVPDLVPHPDATIINVKACGVCRSDWHAWMGHDDEVRLPHVPGHELSGTVASVGDAVQKWIVGDRVTVPFCCGCGTCPECVTGNPHICDQYTQPGFTQWGAFAEQVEVRFADVNLVHLPEAVDYVTAASLGCRFATSFRAIVHQGKTAAGDWVAVHGCGGVGLSAIMIAHAIGAMVIAVDIQPSRLRLAKSLGAIETIDASKQSVVQRICEITTRGAQVSIDALGSHATCWNSIKCLAKRGRHVQVGLMLGNQSNPPIPMGAVIAKELEIYGSHGMQAFEYQRLLTMIEAGTLKPSSLISDKVTLSQGAELLTRMNEFPNAGITVIEID